MRAHFVDGGEAIDGETLAAQGVTWAQHPVVESGWRAPVDALKGDNGYVEEDTVALSAQTAGLDELCAKFADEHCHDDDEVRFVLEGEGIFDIRSRDDRWMHVVVEAGDLIIVPAGRHHRFMLTDARAIRCVRLFKDSSGWTPHYRNAS